MGAPALGPVSALNVTPSLSPCSLSSSGMERLRQVTGPWCVPPPPQSLQPLKAALVAGPPLSPFSGLPVPAGFPVGSGTGAPGLEASRGQTSTCADQSSPGEQAAQSPAQAPGEILEGRLCWVLEGPTGALSDDQMRSGPPKALAGRESLLPGLNPPAHLSPPVPRVPPLQLRPPRPWRPQQAEPATLALHAWTSQILAQWQPLPSSEPSWRP